MHTWRHGRSALAILSIVMSLALLVGNPQPAHAQASQAPQDISPELVTVEALNDQQRQQVDTYIEHWTEQLAQGEPAGVVDARVRLREPLMMGNASDAFRTFYSEQAASALQDALGSDRVIARLNAMIVVSQLNSDVAMPLIQNSLSDESTAVRYWAAKAVSEQTNGQNLTGAQQRELLQILTDRLGQENQAIVVERLMLAVANLNLPQATSSLLDALNQRVALHAQNPAGGLQAEFSALRELFRNLVSQGAGDNASRDAWRQLARASYRYMRLMTDQLQADRLNDRRTRQYTEMLPPLQDNLREAHNLLGSGQSLPSRIDNVAVQGNWNAVLNQLNQWDQVLQAPPFNLSEDDLQVPALPSPQAAGS